MIHLISVYVFSYLFQLCTSKTNPFWWIKNLLLTDVAMVRFEITTRVYAIFDKPFTISFKSNNNTVEILKLIESLPKRIQLGIPRTKEEADFQKLTIFRIDVFKQTEYIVEFFNFTGTDSFDVSNLYGRALAISLKFDCRFTFRTSKSRVTKVFRRKKYPCQYPVLDCSLTITKISMLGIT